MDQKKIIFEKKCLTKENLFYILVTGYLNVNCISDLPGGAMLSFQNKSNLLILLILLIFNCELLSQGIIIKAVNPSDTIRENTIIEVYIDSLADVEVKNVDDISVRSGSKLLPSELIKNYEGKKCLLIQTDFKPREVKELSVFVNAKGNPPVKRTSVHIGEKVDFIKKDRIFTEGKFVSTNRTKIPPDHTPQDAYYQYEGAGWESDKVAYRIYLDERNKIDIFGKIVPDPVLLMTCFPEMNHIPR